MAAEGVGLDCVFAHCVDDCEVISEEWGVGEVRLRRVGVWER